MPKKVNANFPDSDQIYEVIFSDVNHCPICKASISPEMLECSLFDDENDSSAKFAILNLCHNCYNAFIACYSAEKNYNNPNFLINSFTATLEYTGPFFPDYKEFEKEIQELSPYFCELYNEALAAEQYNLTNVSGVGYRKALEFLIKDFSIYQHPEDRNKIEKLPLAQCINSYIENEQLKLVATRAVWLGNDQTHYSTKFTDKTIEDLKNLIKLTIHWISIILETEKASKIEPMK